MSASSTKVSYNVRLEAVEDISPETLADKDGKLQSEHNLENEVARNTLQRVEKLSLNNQAKLSEAEKLLISQQSEIDFIKSTPSNFDLGSVELYQNFFGTIQNYAKDGMPEADLLPNLFAARSDGNFKPGNLKNPRSKFAGAINKLVDMSSLFGSAKHDIAYGEITNSLWIVTSDGAGKRGYLFRCDPQFVDGRLNVLSYWQLDAVGLSLQHFGVCESNFHGVLSIFVGVSDESGFGGHFINRYRIQFDQFSNVITLADGEESSPLVPKYKGNGEILAAQAISSIADLHVETVDITEPGYLRGLEAIHDQLYMVVQNQQNPEQEIDSPGYSFIRSVTISDLGVLTTATNTAIYKLDDITEDKTDGSFTTTHWDVYGISAYRFTNTESQYQFVDQSDVDSSFANSQDRHLFWLGLQHTSTLNKKIVLIDLNYTTVSQLSPFYDLGLVNLAKSKMEIPGFTVGISTSPFITMTLERKLLEINQTTTQNLIAVHDMSGYDIFQGNLDFQSKVKRYFNIENFHAELGVVTSALAINQQAAVTAGPDNSFSFTTTGGSRNRNSSTNPPQFLSGSIFNYHSYLSGVPFWVQPDFTFAVTDGTDNPISGVLSLSWQGTPSSGTALYIGYTNHSKQPALLSIPASTIQAVLPEIGADGFTQYQILTGSPVSAVSGNLGVFQGSASFDPIMQNLWVATSKGFIHNITGGGSTLNYTFGKSFKVLKQFGNPPVGSSGEIFDGSTIIALSVYNNFAYVAMSIPNSNGNAPVNTIYRVFDITQSTSNQPFAESLFASKGIVSDIAVSDKGMWAARSESQVQKIFETHFGINVFDSTEVFDEFNFFKNPALTSNEQGQLGFNIDDVEFFERYNKLQAFQSPEWVLPQKAIAFAMHTPVTNTLNPAKLMVIDYSDVQNPHSWAEFDVSYTTVKNPTAINVSGAILTGSGQIDAITAVADKIFVGRRNYGIGTVINVIDFANNTATIIVDPIQGSGTLFSGMQFGYQNNQTTVTGGLNERNNPSFHYSGFVNVNVKVGPGQILHMSSNLVGNQTSRSIQTPYVAVGRSIPNGYTSGGLDIINGETLEGVIGIGPGFGSIVRTHVNPDGSIFAASSSGTIFKIDDVRLASTDDSQYVTDFSAQSVKVFYPNSVAANQLTDMKVFHYINTLGIAQNIVYATFNQGSGNPTYAVSFPYEVTAEAGGSTAAEFLNNAEVIFFQSVCTNGINAIDFMDDRLFLGFDDPANQFRLAVLKQLEFDIDTTSPFSNNWTRILGSDGATDQYIDYQDLNYQGIKSSIRELTAVQNLSLLFANTPNGSVVFKFPFVAQSKWFSTIKPITADINAVALARDVVAEDDTISEFVERTDTRVQFNGSWQTQAAPVVAPYTAPLYDLPIGRKQMRGSLTDVNGVQFPSTSFKEYQPFSVAPTNNIDFNWDGVSITQKGFDYSQNVLMINEEKGLAIIDFIDIEPGHIDFKPVYKTGGFATVSLNEVNTAVKFFSFTSGVIDNLNPTSYGEIAVSFDILPTSTVPTTFGISQNAVVLVQTLDGRPLATFNDATSTGQVLSGEPVQDLVHDTLADTTKLVVGPDGNPINMVVITGRQAQAQGKSMLKVTVSTFNFAITEKLNK